ncbi:butyrophilin subfamily 1 member A1-like [Anas platyrhynchos]|uniref:butyrophilin subfamily 1 member A1-like n=1 Tax=Anas platyrhynchos TaxID=8839 RepID=UPI003AF22D96
MGLPWGCGCPSLTGHARGLLTSLVTLLLLQLGSAQLRVEGPGQPVTATVGQDVVLPCHLSPQHDAHSLEVRWIRRTISETVHHYRNGEDLYGEQMWAYSGRTELARDGLSDGRLDLRIFGLRPSDDGQYVCTVKDADDYGETIVDLDVTATGADPHLSLGGYEAGGVRVLCRSAGWYPLPQLLWRDARGQHLPLVSQTHSQDQEGLFEIEGTVIVTGNAEGPLSCVVRNSRIQQEWKFSLHIAGTNGTARRRCSCKHRLGPLPWATKAGEKARGLGWEAREHGCSVGLVARRSPPAHVPTQQPSCSAHHLFLRLCFSAAQSRELVKKDAKLAEQARQLEEKCERLDQQATELAWRRFLLPENRVKVTLNPHTAHPELILSEDHRSVRWQMIRQKVPDTPERFDFWCCVLGHEEFREGRHWWEVKVEGELEMYSCWAVGVAKESVERKGKINMDPEEGIWALLYQQGHLTPLRSTRTPLPLSPVPTRIWVCLDCTQQQVSFINADNGFEIFTFTAASFNGESIRPWFWLETLGIQLCLRDSTHENPSPALGGSCPSPATPASPLLDPAGTTQE